eukprot:12749238-Ditylum_brightwellii.AAC.1
MKYSPLMKTTPKMKTTSWALQGDNLRVQGVFCKKIPIVASDNSGEMSSSEKNSELIDSSYATMTNGGGTNKNASGSKPGAKKPVDTRNAL